MRLLLKDVLKTCMYIHIYKCTIDLYKKWKCRFPTVDLVENLHQGCCTRPIDLSRQKLKIMVFAYLLFLIAFIQLVRMVKEYFFTIYVYLKKKCYLVEMISFDLSSCRFPSNSYTKRTPLRHGGSGIFGKSSIFYVPLLIFRIKKLFPWFYLNTRNTDEIFPLVQIFLFVLIRWIASCTKIYNICH